MRFLDIVSMSFGNLFRQFRRILPAIIGVTLSATLAFSVIISGYTATHILTQQILGQGSLREIIVTVDQNANFSQNASQPQAITDSQISSWKSIPHVLAAYPDLQLNITASAEGEGIFILLMNQPDKSELKLLQGTWPQNNQILVPDKGLLNKQDQPIDGSSILGKTVLLNIPNPNSAMNYQQVPVTVSGIYARQTDVLLNPLGFGIAYTNLSFMKNLVQQNQNSPQTSYQLATVIADSSQNVGGIESKISNQNFSAESILNQISGLNARVQSVMAIGLAIGLFILLLVALSIGNLLITHLTQDEQKGTK